MGVIADRERNIRNIVRLRRAERTARDAADIVAVRTDIERSVGRTVSRALSARLLGISQTALDRRIDQGLIPVVMTPNGRHEVPLTALLDLIEDVESRRHDPAAARPVTAVLRSREALAEELAADTILPRRYRREAAKRDHGRAELQSLAYHRAVARRLDREIVDEARQRLRRWSEEGKIDPRYAESWERLLQRPLPSIARVISQNGQRARDLRQNSPFAGTLTEQERRMVLRALE